MLRGFFKAIDGSPYLRGRIIIPRLNFFAELDFLVDTGADTTLLAPRDGGRFGLDYAMLRPNAWSQGTSGVVANAVERGVLGLRDDREPVVYTYELDVYVLPASANVMALPSLLGRDVIDRCRMTYDPSVGELTFDVHAADDMVPVI